MQNNESGNPAYEPKMIRRAFRFLSADAVLYYCGLGILDGSTIIPAFLATLTTSTIIIGAISAIKPACYFIPQLWVAHHLRNRTRHKDYLMKYALMSRISISLFALVMLLSGPGDRSIMLWGFIAMYTFFWLSEGLVGISWLDLTAKTIPERMRGRLYGFIQFGGAILAMGSAWFAKVILDPSGPSYPRNYAILWTYAAFFFCASLASLSFMHEPEGLPEKQDGNFLEYVRNIGKMLAGNGQFKRVLAIQLLMGFIGMSLPFFIIYAKKSTGFSGGMVGIFALIQIAGSAIASAISGYVSDHRGPKAVILLGAITGLLAPVLAIISGSSLWSYGLVFFMVGCTLGSGWIGVLNFVMELSEPHERKSYLGLQNTANAPTLLFPLLGGLIIRMTSYQTLFIVTAIASVVAVVLAVGLCPRRATE